MALDQAKAFLEGLASNEKAQEIIKASGTQDEGAMYDAYAEAAKETGYDVAVDELVKVADELRAAAAKKSDEAAKGVAELSDEDLDKVAGGKVQGFKREVHGLTAFYTYCADNYRPGENCWFDDDCNYTFLHYSWEPMGYEETGTYSLD